MADFSPTRTHATWKPRVTAERVPFFRCSECGAIVSGIDGNVPIEMRNDGERSLIAELPYAHADFQPCCHGKPMEKLEVVHADEVMDRIKLTYEILGGMNNNVVFLNWTEKEPGCKLRWAALKTFTGVMMKYVTPKKWPPLRFALADEDAFAYCDQDPCNGCTFRCKRGMEFYCYVENVGLVVLPLDHMKAPGSKATFSDIKVPTEK